ncbi:unnamed protein product (macronuclear) [Paramecium tetraurelia]|uniref:Uncharacterized protein n=1 Tax=Paramecium tetraurelia TaxID=5888 RepID=A0DD84_PARTE|nr:uncharacterized protein GSPATT00015860001 [Paramecium tetraurelia]CAK81001.1 unnamed protein product [Paramecium tetraurelia]|eukprot:XP_001448398.1 hypothetical protein (macronuclear) [Paramecium tetraurelia strain d4-2]
MDLSREPLSIKLVVIGDGSVGKTCILLSYTTDKFPTEYVPTVFENYITSVSLDGKQINLSLWDTAGQETYDKLRTLSYSQADWINHHLIMRKISGTQNQGQGDLKNIPKLVVGNKIDCRNEISQKHVKFEEASEEFKSQNLVYKECSALTQEGLKELFEEAIKQGYEHKQKNPQTLKNQNQKDRVEDKQENCCCNAF